MSNVNRPSDLAEIAPPFTGIAGLSTLAWIIFGLAEFLDKDRYYFTITMILSGLLVAYQLRHSRRNRNPLQGSTVVFYVIIWLAVFTFTPDSTNVVFSDYSLRLHQLELLALLPLALIWVPPYKKEKFFGIMDLERNDKLHAIWRSSVLMLIVIKLIEFEDKWYWRSLEFIILIPMIYETSQLQKSKKEEIPVLTLFIQTEMTEKFGVPLSMFKSVFFIMVAFLFEILDSRLWLLVILVYFAAGIIWGISTLIPDEMKSDDESKDEFSDNIRDMFGAEKRKGRRRRSKRKSHTVLQDMEDSIKELESPKTQTDIVPIEVSETQLTAKGTSGSIQEKAHAMGKRVRTGIEKPYYTLNHILSTLKEEDFSEAWRVHKDGMILPSKRGNWSPSKGLILFPVELENYDFRRTNEILLLGFNRPFEKKKGGVTITTGKKRSARISDNSIKFGDVEFNTRSLIVTQDQWEEIKSKLESVSQDDDISHTGFKTLKQMQEVLASMSEKWLEVRVTAQEAAVNFLAGLLGSANPIFVPKEGLEAPSYPEIEGNIVDSAIEEEEKE